MRAIFQVAFLVFFVQSFACWAQSKPDVTASVCGSIQEPVMFGLWHRAAGNPHDNAGSELTNVTPISFLTRDGIVLRGYKLSAIPGPSKGSLLVAQGNAMLAEQTLHALNQFAHADIDTYVFDFRGYGKSEGVSRLAAIVDDYKEITTSLVATTTGPHLLYGISFGGIVLLDAAGANNDYTHIVIDSTPSRVSTHGCPISYDPVVNLPSIGSRLLVIAGGQDRVVTKEMSRELVEKAATSGAKIDVNPEFAHPFMDADRNVALKRFGVVLSFRKRAISHT